MKPDSKQSSISFPSEILRHQRNGLSLPEAFGGTDQWFYDSATEEKAEGPGHKGDSFLHISSYRWSDQEVALALKFSAPEFVWNVLLSLSLLA